jgi:hypothetical protein
MQHRCVERHDQSREPNTDTSKDARVQGAQHWHVERYKGAGSPTLACQKMRGCREPNTGASKDMMVKEAQHQYVQRHEGTGNPALMCQKTQGHREPNSNVSKDGRVQGT